MTEYICIGDIHGRNDLLNQIIKYKDFNYIFLGDYIDRGSNSLQVIKTIMNLPNAICLMGNHEQMFLDSLKSAYTMHNSISRSAYKIEPILNNHLETIQSFVSNTRYENIFNQFKSLYLNRDYCDDFVKLLKECLIFIDVHYQKEIQFLQNLYTYVESDNYVLSHSGGCKNKLPIDNNLDDWLWTRDFKQPLNNKIYIYGHTPTQSGKIEINKNNINIDTGAVFKNCEIGTYKININDKIKLIKLND